MQRTDSFKLASAIAFGLTAAILARVVMFVATGPHSVIFGSQPSQIPLALLFGVVVFALSARTIKRPTPVVLLKGLLSVVIALFAHWAVFDVSAANQWMPGLWVK